MSFHFLTNKEIKLKKDREEANIELAKKHGCEICPLKEVSNQTPDMQPTGSSEPIIYILGEAPSADEDKLGVQFIGKSGALLRSSFRQFISREELKKSLRFNNCLRCRPLSNSTPTILELECCRASVEKDIEETKPALIMGFGNIPLKWFIGLEGITSWRGRKIPVKIGNHSCWFLPLFHPAFILKRQSRGFKNEYDLVFEKDIEDGILLLEDDQEPKVVESNYFDNIKLYENIDDKAIKEIQKDLNKLKKVDVGLDIETSCLKPWQPDAKILSIAIGNAELTISYPLEHPAIPKKYQKQLLKITQDFLLNSKTKVCHNLKFELIWFYHYFSEEVIRAAGWADTMAQAYVLDERSMGKVLQLNSLVIQHLGFALKDLSNIDITNLIEEPLGTLLKYNGLDAKYTHAVYEKQKGLIDSKLNKLYNQHVELSKTLTATETKGLIIDRSKLEELEDTLKVEIEQIEEEINNREEVKEFEEMFEREFKHTSNKDLPLMFQDILGLAPIKKTPTGRYCTDKTVLAAFAEDGIELAQLITKYRELAKLKSTYVSSIPELLGIDGKLRPDFGSMFTATSRLNARNPNIQNFPKRKNSHVRQFIIAPKDHYIVPIDYGQLEARMIAQASQDKKFIDAILTGYDIHMEWADKIAKLSPSSAGVDKYSDLSKKDLKVFRSDIKNKLVFPWFYSASYRSVGESLGIPEKIMEKIYEQFWKEFEGVKKWQNKLNNFYKKNQFVQALNGRRRRAPVNKTIITNTTIQSLASDVVINAMNRLSLMSYELNRPQLQAVMNIHDDLTFYIPEATFEEDIMIIVKEMTKLPYKFMNVPLSVEVSVGRNWYEVEEMATFESRDFGWL